MRESTFIDNIYSQPTWHFWHLEQEYFIFLEVYDDEDYEPRAMHLAKPKQEEGLWVPDYCASEMILPSVIAELGTKRFTDEVFLPTANEYLAALGGENPDFPLTGSHFEQFNWVVRNDLQYINGQISRITE